MWVYFRRGEKKKKKNAEVILQFQSLPWQLIGMWDSEASGILC